MEGSETHELATFQSYTSSVTGLPLPVSTGQGVVNVAQPVVSQAQVEGVTSISLCRRIHYPETFIYPVVFTRINRV